MINCQVCESETTYLIKFESIPEPLCWECVWSYLKVREKVIGYIRKRRYPATINGLMREVFDTVANINEISRNEFTD